MARVTTAYVSDFQRDRVHRSDFYRGESTTYVTQFRAAIPEDDYISYVEWRCDRPDVTRLSNQLADNTSGTVTLTITNSGIGSIKTIATLASGKKVVQNHIVFCNPSSWYQGESGTIPQGPTYLRADASVPPGDTLSVVGDAPSGTVGLPYYFKYAVSGGTPPVTGGYTGTLPGGVSFNNATFEISGVPTTVLTSNFSVVATSADHQQVTHPDSISITGASFEQIILSDNPIYYLPLNEPSGVIATDLTGNNHTGTYVGTPVHSSMALRPNGRSVQTTAIGQYVSIANGSYADTIFTGRHPWSAEIIMRRTGRLASSSERMMGKFVNGNTGNSTFDVAVSQNQSANYVISGGFYDTNGAQYFSASSVPVVNNQPFIVCVTYDGLVISLYVNGSLISTTNAAVTGQNINSPITIGGSDAFSSSYQFQGYLSDASLYDYALSPGRILAHAVAAGLA